MPVLIRSWNLYHGNAHPSSGRSYLAEMARLVSAGSPDLVLLQEVPAWALARLGDWSGMIAVADVAQRPRLGPLPITAELGRVLTEIRPGLLRSAFSGQGNAILLDRRLRPAAHEVLTLNSRGFRREQAPRLGLDLVARLAWAKERRICQAVRVERDDGGTLAVANLHATSSPGDARIPAAELDRAVGWLEGFARPDEVVILGGDFNVLGPDLRLRGFSDPGPGIDHLLVRGARPAASRIWADERRRLAGEDVLLSDHAPIELELS